MNKFKSPPNVFQSEFSEKKFKEKIGQVPGLEPRCTLVKSEILPAELGRHW